FGRTAEGASGRTYTSPQNAGLICRMTSEARPPRFLFGAGCKDVDGRDKRGHDTGGASVNLFVAWYYTSQR
ncbi:MAG TPA: hypothetical protein VMB73_22310, partial [Acetobacteraceae bacterium]|nr:hypothetical protein [Acetobacteraceae bacterium]